MQKFSVGTVSLPGPKGLFLIAGPCLIENRRMAMDVAAELDRIRKKEDVRVIFKGSYRKANRSSASSYTGIGDRQALEILREIRDYFGMPVLTDVHETSEVELAASYVDVLQIPAFLCRQTDLIVAAASTGLAVNIKKGQFLAPEDMALAAAKAAATGNKKIMLTERGTTFGYHNLVVDYRGLPIMAESGWPVILDVTHSVQLPGAGAGVSGGDRRFLMPLARAAVAAGVDGLFFEVHPDPATAMSDASTQAPLAGFGEMVRELMQLQRCMQSIREEFHSR
ncbi:MAG TPA: 3-deoxy-8-phosphooctulonate synthase [Chlorobaculum sp.]|uniref:3-deoxy-8-phosphooctulonate synthase n=1 Tax=Chlorobaculum tepidum (strain ATCC 49652 / DSM 12025 / NBRC 103806 / TLS) TaxID=194439 RepID=Q8KG80_CHLTE|nr:3-deoxy-8-phosphooctulonate synthase [Chlorobaculum tepidum]AAM71336.1 2-dehydro-3-deoxyphosphooctonate aldolase [Chlorobaculum tepidum TLS]HBU24346.1 3-deoxy-8-phosphooctulonate synthase [Chlorobaculum sp.]